MDTVAGAIKKKNDSNRYNSLIRDLPERWHRVSLSLAENHDVCIGASFHQTALLPQNRGRFSTDRFYSIFNRSEKGIAREYFYLKLGTGWPWPGHVNTTLDLAIISFHPRFISPISAGALLPIGSDDSENESVSTKPEITEKVHL